MSSFKKILVLPCLAVLASCSVFQGGESVDVEKPAVDQTVFDLTNSGNNGFSDPAVVGALSTSNVEVYSLDAEAVPVADTLADDSAGYVAYGNNRSVEMANAPDTSLPNVHLTPPSSYSMAPVRPVSGDGTISSAGPEGDFVTVRTPGQPDARVYFDHGSAQLDEADIGVIADVARRYNGNREEALSVEGHASVTSEIADPVERKAVNLKVSMDRAFAVSRALMHNGIPAEKIRTVAWGEEQNAPPMDGQDSESSARRVDILPVSGQ